MSNNFGSKRIVVGAHYGMRDWLSQRVTAVLMALFTLVLLAHQGLGPAAVLAELDRRFGLSGIAEKAARPS